MTRTRHALITGGSRGIGLAIAQLFASKAYRITLVSRTASDLQSAVSTLAPITPSPSSSNIPNASISSSSQTPPQHSYIASPISTLPTNFPNHLPIDDKASKIDILVNCAGITQEKLFIRMSDEHVHDIINTNLTAMMILTKTLLRKGYFYNPKKPTDYTDVEEGGQRGGKGEEAPGPGPVIINIASLLGLQGGHGAVAYAASKAGVLGFTRALAAETGRSGIRVNAVVPGYIETDMTAHLQTSNILNRIPLSRFGTSEEVADAVWFLANNSYAHNCVLNLDGGLSAT